MAIFRLTKDSLTELPETSFASNGVLERSHLQRLLRENIGAIATDLMVIAEEFGKWVDSFRRIDLLCIDRDANLVVVELKRSEDGGYMDLQAIRYAAMISTLTFEQLVEAHREFLSATGKAAEQAHDNILAFLGWDSAQEDRFANEVRIILASADFSRELTTSVLWLNESGLDIRCVRLKPYKDQDGIVLLDVQQLIPLPEAAEYQTKIKAKEQAGKVHFSERHDLRYKFWTQLLPFAKTKTDLHANRSGGHYGALGVSYGRAGLQLNYVIGESTSRIELYIDLGAGSDERNLKIFNALELHKDEIEKVFGDKLEWQSLPGTRACRIRYDIEGGYRTPEAEWPDLQSVMVAKMISFESAIRPFSSSMTA
jgi:hypothetical protein